ncbi:putative RNA methyltransferase [Gordonia araii]|uniref:putative RNA methyltransferase n=1 Tax=Gordonia araii TaxID=263909 RepID=UPI00268D1CE8
MLGAVRCPVCAQSLTRVSAATLGCGRGHRFDIARQGYVSLLTGRSTGLSSDTAEMIAARRAALAGLPYRALREAVAGSVAAALTDTAEDTHERPRKSPLIVDAGCGTGQYLASCLDAHPDALGLGLDLSKYAARATAKAHDRAAAAVADLWQPWPLADGCASVVVSVFAPRGLAQARRVLVSGGTLVVATPRVDHLAELIEPMGMLDVAPDKVERLGESLAAAGFGPVSTTAISRRDAWTADAVVDAVAMGPSAFHTSPEQLRARARQLCGSDNTVEVTTSVDVTVARSG